MVFSFLSIGISLGVSLKDDNSAKGDTMQEGDEYDIIKVNCIVIGVNYDVIRVNYNVIGIVGLLAFYFCLHICVNLIHYSSRAL